MMTAVHCLARWGLSLVWVAVTHLAALCLAFGNFVVTWQAFEAQGYEPTPLAEVPFLGAFAVSLGLGAAPLSSLYALVLTGAMNIATIASAKMVTRLRDLVFDWRQVRRAEDPSIRARGKEYLAKIWEEATWAVPTLFLTVLIARWDVAQFGYRQAALARGLVDPSEATTWPLDPVARVGVYLANFFATAAWGYVACVVATALAMEHSYARAREQWRALGHAIEDAVTGSGSAAPRAGAVDGEATDAAGEATDAAAPVSAGSTSPVQQGPEVPAPESGAVPVPVPAPAEPDTLPVPAAPVSAPTVDVIVAPGRVERTPLADVEARPDRYVRDSSGRQWFLRQYYEEAMKAGEATEQA